LRLLISLICTTTSAALSTALTTRFDYDTVGRRTAIYRPDNSVVRFAYDVGGNMTVLTTPAGAAHDFEYNAVNRNSAYDTPVSGSYVYGYDCDRRLTKITFPSGKIISRTYQEDQLLSVATPEYTVNYSYEPCGSTVKSLTKGSEVVTYGHDGSLVTPPGLFVFSTPLLLRGGSRHVGAAGPQKREYTWTSLRNSTTSSSVREGRTAASFSTIQSVVTTKSFLVSYSRSKAYWAMV